MHNIFTKIIVISLTLPFFLFGCTPIESATDPNLIWKVEILKYEVKDMLEGIEIVQLYVGSTEVIHQQYPDDGNVYLILKVSISKQGADTNPFVWDQLVVQDSAGQTYTRHSNDSFVELYEYTPRITGLELIYGENEGWMCYEIPIEAANDILILKYSGEGSQQEIVVNK